MLYSGIFPNLSMVFIIDEGSVFDASLDKLWKYVASPEQHRHPSQINPEFSLEGEKRVVAFNAKMPDGREVRNKIAMTPLPPVGFSLEYLEGPFAGSKSFQFYTPKGGETAVTVVGDYNSQWMSGEQLKQAVIRSLEIAFNEDQENLKHF